MKLSDAIDAYLVDRNVKGIKRSTIVNDRVTLNKLLAVLGNLDTRSIQTVHIDKFWRRIAHLSPGSKNRAKVQLSAFFKWLQGRGLMARDLNLLEGYRKLKVPPPQRIIIPPEEFATLLDGIKDPRDRIIVALSLYLFTRISETKLLRWQDFDLDSDMPSVQVYRPKTEQLDTLPVCSELVDELRRWKLEYGALIGQQVQPGWLVIPGRTRPELRGVPGHKSRLEVVKPSEYEPHRPAFLGYAITNLLKEAGYYGPKEGGHTFRRSGAIALYHRLADEGHDRAIRICQAMLGHSSIQTTEIYLRLDVDRKHRNDLLAGKPMFPKKRTSAPVVQLRTDEAR